MGEFKKIILPVLGTMLFIVGVGMFSQKKGIFNFNPTPTPLAFQKVTLTFDKTEVEAQVADSEEKRKIGLSKTKNLADDAGMLFVFDHKDIRPSFWMKEMQIAIDILWLNDKKIVKIDKNIQPPTVSTKDEDLKLYKPNGVVDYVLEVNAGFSDKHNLKVGTAYEGY